MPAGYREIIISLMDIVVIDMIITDVRYIMTVPVTMSEQAMLTLMITDLNTEVKDIAVRLVSTILRKVNGPVSQKNISSKPAIRPGPPIQIVTSRKPFGYEKVIRKEARRLQRQTQAELNRTITDKIPVL
jgi:hypothetical protein